MAKIKKRDLPARFRKLPVDEKRHVLAEVTDVDGADFLATGECEQLVQLSDVLIESAIGYIAVPLGIADGYLIDGDLYRVPLATEEPSVVAAATYAAKIIGASGGFVTWSHEPIMAGTVYFERADGLLERIESRRNEYEALLDTHFTRMKARGGGFRSMTFEDIGGYIKVRFTVDVRDAMGANAINTAAELLGRRITETQKINPILTILTNAAVERRGGAEFSLESRYVPASDRFDSDTVCKRIVEASRIADIDPERGVTHNKGIMNGITALALATGNDTRGIESAAHAWASRDGAYRPLSGFEYSSGVLTGKIELPLPFATTGGAISFHPAARTSLAVLEHPVSSKLARIAAAVGLGQNFAALLALVSGGIQRGHMRLHARRLAFTAGARTEDVETVASELVQSGCIDLEHARLAYGELIKNRDPQPNEQDAK